MILRVTWRRQIITCESGTNLRWRYMEASPSFSCIVQGLLPPENPCDLVRSIKVISWEMSALTTGSEVTFWLPFMSQHATRDC
jgi:hypothetical protein